MAVPCDQVCDALRASRNHASAARRAACAAAGPAGTLIASRNPPPAKCDAHVQRAFFRPAEKGAVSPALTRGRYASLGELNADAPVLHALVAQQPLGRVPISAAARPIAVIAISAPAGEVGACDTARHRSAPRSHATPAAPRLSNKAPGRLHAACLAGKTPRRGNSRGHVCAENKGVSTVRETYLLQQALLAAPPSHTPMLPRQMKTHRGK